MKNLFEIVSHNNGAVCLDYENFVAVYNSLGFGIPLSILNPIEIVLVATLEDR